MDIEHQSSQPLKRKDRDNDLATAQLKPSKKPSQCIIPSTIEPKIDILPAPTRKFEFLETHHTISNLPNNSILVHATNCVGTWGAGFAKAVRAQYPLADKVYVRHCSSFYGRSATKAAAGAAAGAGLPGTCLLIPPQSEGSGTPAVWIACLFTSYSYGRRKDRPEKIVVQTERALGDLRLQLDGIGEGRGVVESIDDGSGGAGLRVVRLVGDGSRDGSGTDSGNIILPSPSLSPPPSPPPPPDMRIYSPRFNAGNFKVPWEDTVRSVEDAFGTWEGKWYLLGDK